MYQYFVSLSKLCLILFVLSCTDTVEVSPSSQLLDFWQKKISLSAEQQKQYASENIASSDDDYLKAISHFMMGYFNTKKGDYTNALVNHAKAEHHMIESGVIDDKLFGHIYRDRAFIFMKYNLYEKAFSYFDSALAHYNRYPDDFVKERLATRYNQGLALKHFDAKQALTYSQKLYEESQNHLNANYELKALMLMGDVYISMTDYVNAEAQLSNAIKLFENTNLESQKIETQLYHTLSRIYYYTGDFTQQEIYLRHSIALGLESKAFALQVDLGESLIEQGKKEEALMLLVDLEKTYDQQVLHKDHIRIYELLAAVAPDPSRYLQKGLDAQETYQQKSDEILILQRQDELRAIQQQVAYEIAQTKENALSKRREYFFRVGFGALTLFGLVFATLYFYQQRKQLNLRKKLTRFFRNIDHIHQEKNQTIGSLQNRTDFSKKDH